MGFDELAKIVVEGAAFRTYLLLNALVLGAQYAASVSTRAGFLFAAAIGATVGGLGAYGEAMATVGVAPTVMTNAAISGAVIGAGSSTVVGWMLKLALDKTGIFPVSAAKQQAEAIRDPMNPATPQ